MTSTLSFPPNRCDTLNNIIRKVFSRDKPCLTICMRGRGVGIRPKTDSQPIRIVIVDIYILEHLTNRTVTPPTYITLRVHSKDLSGLPDTITSLSALKVRGRGTSFILVIQISTGKLTEKLKSR